MGTSLDLLKETQTERVPRLRQGNFRKIPSIALLKQIENALKKSKKTTTTTTKLFNQYLFVSVCKMFIISHRLFIFKRGSQKTS